MTGAAEALVNRMIAEAGHETCPERVRAILAQPRDRLIDPDLHDCCRRYVGKNWWEITDDDLDNRDICLSLFGVEVFDYYLPRFIIYAFEHYQPGSIYYFISILMYIQPPRKPKKLEAFSRRFESMSESRVAYYGIPEHPCIQP